MSTPTAMAARRALASAAALDLARKNGFMPYLERLHRELDITLVYVSHAPD